MTTADTTAPAQPELRVTIIVPLPADPFEQADLVSMFAPLIDAFEQQMHGRGITDFTLEKRVVKPKPPKRAAAPVLAALLAMLFLPACVTPGGAEPDCLRSTQEHCLPTPSDEHLGAGEA
jgi:hypothetical protein